MPVIERTRPVTGAESRTERPPLYKVILLNDDYTPFEVVHAALMEVFAVDWDKASAIMIEAHRKGSTVVASYQRDVAETKARDAEAFAQAHGAALKFPVERE